MKKLRQSTLVAFFCFPALLLSESPAEEEKKEPASPKVGQVVPELKGEGLTWLNVEKPIRLKPLRSKKRVLLMFATVF